MPLSIAHQADSAGDKAVSLIADNSGSNVAAAFKGANKATQNGDTVADLVVTLDGETVDLSIQKTEDAAHNSGDKGIMALAVRQDTLAALAGTTGDYIPLTTDALGALNVATRGGYADNDTFTRGSSRLLAGLAGIYESTVATLTAGKVALARLTSRGGVVQSRDKWTPSALVSAEELRDTSNHSANISMAEASKVAFIVTNAHDQSMYFRLFYTSGSSPNTRRFVEILIPAGDVAVLVGADGYSSGDGTYLVPLLSDYLYTTMRYEVNATTLPTTGSWSLTASFGG